MSGHAESAGRGWARAGLLAAGLMSGMLLAELLVRVLDLPPHPLAPLHVGSYRLSDDPILRYEYQPGLAPDHAAYDPMHRGLATNALGFRDREFETQKPRGGVRVLALGDSATAGLGVPELGDTWPKQLERRLRQRMKRPVEVLNLGVGGYDTLQEVRLLRRRGLDLDPDLVLLLVTLNDLDSGVDGGVYDALLRARAHLDAPRRDGWGWLQQHSRLVFFAVHRLRGPVRDQGPRRSREREGVGSPLEAGLVQLRALQARHGFGVVVFLLPGLDSSHSRYRHSALHRRMQAIAKDVGGIEWIDLLEGMAAASSNLRLLSIDGMHPNRVGQAAIADRMFRELRRRGLP